MKDLMNKTPSDILSGQATDRLTGNTISINFQDLLSSQGTLDSNMIGYEVHNRMKEDLFFVEMEKSPVFTGKKLAVVPDGFLFLPHNYFTVYTKSGAPAEFLRNYGTEKFKGNKKASRLV